MNKDLKGIILFAGLFLFICWLYIILLIPVQILECTPLCSPFDEKEICLSLKIYVLLLTKLFQVIGLTCISFYGILKSHNPFIVKIFNSWDVPLAILLIFFFIDISVNLFAQLIDKQFISIFIPTYNIFLALSGNFLVIYIFSIGYQFIKLIKEKIHQLKR